MIDVCGVSSGPKEIEGCQQGTYRNKLSEAELTYCASNEVAGTICMFFLWHFVGACPVGV